MKYPETGVTSPSQIAIVGDRLFTDVMMANLMGSYAFWLRDGVVKNKGIVGHPSDDSGFTLIKSILVGIYYRKLVRQLLALSRISCA